MNGNIRVGNLFGIPFYVNPSWFLVLGLVTLTYGSELSLFPGLTGIMPWLLGFVASLLLFASVLAHELGHSLVAIQQGIEVKSITLFLFGGLANLEKESKTPSEAFLVAIAGPAVSLLLFGLFTAIGIGTPISGAFAAIVSLLASINLILALFNLLPGLPLDGGNVVKSIVWKITGNQYKGVLFASRIGQFLGWLAVIIGILAILGISQIGSFWTLLIGGFLLQNANNYAKSAQIQEKLSGLTAADAVIPDSPIIDSNLTLREFANEYVIGKRNWRKFLVTDAEGKLVGAISVDSMRTIPTSQWNEVKVSDIIQSVENTTVIDSDKSLLDVLMLLEKAEIKQLPVVRENGVVIGLLEKASILRLLEKQPQPNPV
ncbi:MAG: site-2 protease family protein [Oscillatoria sp. PMC 1068.18]|nr:site-2 protease family protein [Oscillatoria sp. PMC 1076.18]MEC4990612.1 site-2 protease family protein [Oscillatoria sp. PMC 1068.18]